MNRIRALTAIGGVALAVSATACGSSASRSNSSIPNQAANSSSGVLPLETVHAGGLSVLADRTGMPLYSPAQETSGKILCTTTNGCTSFWKPLIISGSTPRAPHGLGKIGVIKLADGTHQLTVNSRPLYTFVQDSPGQVHGNGFKDAFGGQHFTWHVILSSGKPAGSANSGSSSTSGGGYSPY